MKYLIGLCLVLAFASDSHAKIMPENDWKIPPSRHLEANAISERSFNMALNRVEQMYKPIVKQMGFNLIILRRWEDGTVNSDTYEDGQDWIINSYGGLARYPGMNTMAAYALVACHELGHHMGGAPLYNGGTDWASTEGESDYWASKECMKQIGFSSSSIKAASLALARVLADLGGEPPPSGRRIDTTVRRHSLESHPPAQCRLDTYLGGEKCPERGLMSKRDPRINACWEYPDRATYKKGSRPRCWFAP